jgi:hypothetical protein
VYFYLKISEEDEFEHNFHENAELILRAIRKNLVLTLGVVDVMAFNMVSSARSSGEDWPFVTIPDFGVRAAKVLALTEVAFLAVHPLVSDEEREQWENYTASNNNWVSLVHLFLDCCLNCFLSRALVSLPGSRRNRTSEERRCFSGACYQQFREMEGDPLRR